MKPVVMSRCRRGDWYGSASVGLGVGVAVEVIFGRSIRVCLGKTMIKVRNNRCRDDS